METKCSTCRNCLYCYKRTATIGTCLIDGSNTLLDNEVDSWNTTIDNCFFRDKYNPIKYIILEAIDNDIRFSHVFLAVEVEKNNILECTNLMRQLYLETMSYDIILIAGVITTDGVVFKRSPYVNTLSFVDACKKFKDINIIRFNRFASPDEVL